MELLLTVVSCGGLPPDAPLGLRTGLGLCTLGRSPGNHLPLPDPDRLVSGRHAEIEVRQDGVWITDRSTNGTFINGSGERIPPGQPVQIQNGDTLGIGPYEISVALTGAATAPTTEPFATPTQSEVGELPGMQMPEGSQDIMALLGGSPGQPSPHAVTPRDPFADAQALDAALYGPAPDAEPAGAQHRPTPVEHAYFRPPETQPIPEDFDLLAGLPLTPGAPAEAQPALSPLDPFADPFGFEPPPAAPPETPNTFGAPAFESPVASAMPAGAPSIDSPTMPPGHSHTPSAPTLASSAGPSGPHASAWEPEPPPVGREPVSSSAHGSLAELIGTGSPVEEPERAPVAVPTPGGGVAAARLELAPEPAPVMDLSPGTESSGQPLHAETATPIAPGAPASGGVDAGLAALFAGLGLGDPAQIRDPEVLMRSTGALLRAMTAGLVATMMVRARFKSELRVGMTTLRPTENNPFKFSVGPDDALERLLLRPNPGFLPPLEAAREAFDDIQAHEMATLAGLRAALRALLARFEPAALEARLEPATSFDKVLPMARKARYWEQFTEAYSRVAADAEEDFMQLFGEAFTQAYEDQIARLAQARARRTPT
jgi:type VI secretion system protein